MDQRVKVLYIASMSRSGSTILDNILGQIDGFFTVGEVFWSVQRNFKANALCGCGKPISECEIWQPILKQAFGSIDQLDSLPLKTISQQARTRHLLKLMTRGGQRSYAQQLKDYVPTLAKLYQTVQAVTGCSVIVDSSKLPLYGFALNTIPSIDLYVVHIIRDPRAVAYSFMRKKESPLAGRKYMTQQRPHISAMLWGLHNLAIERGLQLGAQRYMKILYEDFVRQPRQHVEQIVRFVGESPASLPFSSETEVHLEPTHTAGGNPDRMKTGAINIRMDDAWKAKLDRPSRALVSSLAWPLLLKYHYSLL